MWKGSLNYRNVQPIVTKSQDGRFSSFTLPVMTPKETTAVDKQTRKLERVLAERSNEIAYFGDLPPLPDTEDVRHYI